jgi:hypothetical protein
MEKKWYKKGAVDTFIDEIEPLLRANSESRNGHWN